MDLWIYGISVSDRYNTNIVHVITLDSLQLLYLADEAQACLTDWYMTVNTAINYNQFMKRWIFGRIRMDHVTFISLWTVRKILWCPFIILICCSYIWNLTNANTTLNPLSVGFWNAFCLMTPMWLQIVNWCIVYGIWNSSWRGVTRPLHVC